MQTINSNAHQRNGFHKESSSTFLKRFDEEFSNREKTTGSVGGRHSNFDSETVKESGIDEKSSSIAGRAGNEDDKDKKRDRKWFLGSFFKKKFARKEEEDSSDECEDEGNKRGFLSRRKLKREKRKLKSRTGANGFDIVIPQIKDQKSGTDSKTTLGRLWEESAKDLDNAGSGNGSMRFIHRQRSVIEDLDSSQRSNGFLQVPRQQLKHSCSARNNNAFDGRKNRKEVLARAEAMRHLICDESSSDECESYHSNSSLNKSNGDVPACRRSRRNKRLSRTSEGGISFESRLVKSDMEGSRRRFPYGTPFFKTSYLDPNDGEMTMKNFINHSTTSSPSRSPRIRQKQSHNYDQNSYSMRTFPPVVYHIPPSRRLPLTQSNRRSFQGGEIEGSENHLNVLCAMENRALRPVGSFDQHSLRLSTVSREFKEKGKSVSVDEDIHKVPLFPIKISKSPPLIQRSSDNSIIPGTDFQCFNSISPKRMESDERCTSGGIRSEFSKPAGNKYSRGSNENMPERSFQRSPFCLLERSPSKNSFYQNYVNYGPNRSTSYQHIPTYLGTSLSEIPVGLSPPSTSNRFHKTHEIEMERENNVNDVRIKRPESKPDLPPVASKVPDSVSNCLRYYADQNPRSRNPIQITYGPDHSYLSDSQIASKHLDGGFLEKSVMRDENAVTLRLKNSSINDEVIKFDQVPNKVLKRNGKIPPEPPIRRLSKQEVSEKLNKCEALKKLENKNDSNNNHCSNEVVRNVEHNKGNLDDALNELEIIYNSLRLRDEDLVDRAERRDLPVYRNGANRSDHAIHNRSDENDLMKDNLLKTETEDRQRAYPLRRSAVPDKVFDDMAFRRMKANERSDVIKKFPSQSYLRSSPALSPVFGGSPVPRKESPVAEPDITHDDVVFRNIRHANSTLKIQDPQPPFGIPIGVISPASNSDYLHATPKCRFRPTFTSSRTPDIVKDDLAFRNLRKDDKTKNYSSDSKTDSDFMAKKKAVRSLSANIQNIMQRENSHPCLYANGSTNRNAEKAQSLTDLTNEWWESKQKALENRLKDLKEKKKYQRAEFFGSTRPGNEQVLKTWKKEDGGPENDQNPRESRLTDAAFEKKSMICPVVKLSKFPAAAPSPSEPENPFKEVTSSIDEDQLERMLSTLAAEARHASRDLERQLDELESQRKKGNSLADNSGTHFPADKNAPDDSAKKKHENGLLEPIHKNAEKNYVVPHLRSGSQEKEGKNDDLKEIQQNIVKSTRKSKTASDKYEDEFDSVSTFEFPFTNVHCDSQTEKISDENPVVAQSEWSDESPDPRKEKDIFQKVYEYNCSLSNENDEDPKPFGSDEKASASPESATEAEPQPTAKEKTDGNVESEGTRCEGSHRWSRDCPDSPDADGPDGPDASDGLRLPLTDFGATQKDGAAGSGNGSSQGSRKREGEVKPPSVKSDVWLACSYALAFAFHLQEIDFATALGLFLALLSVLAIFIL